MKNKELKTALVTGASRGIGYEIARLAAADGYNLAVVSRSGDDLYSVKGELEDEFDITVEPIEGDLSDPDTPKEIHDRLLETDMWVDLLVNNAGRGQMGEFTETDWEVDEEMMQINMGAVVHLTDLFLPQMIERGEGKILNVSSLAAFAPGPLMTLYYATKAFVQNFSEGLAEEVAGEGVTVTALSPGPVDTGFEIKGVKPSENGNKSVRVSPELAAREGYNGVMSGRRVVVPGGAVSLAPGITRLLPRRAVSRFIRRLNQKLLEE